MAAIRVAELETAFTANTRALDRGFQHAERAASRTASNINSAFGRIQMGSGMGGGGLLPGLANISNIIQGLPQIGNLASALVRPLTDAAERGVRLNAVLETAQIGFEGVAGSAEGAAQHIRNLKDFGRNTPFEFEGLLQASRYMTTFGFSLEE
ncbi:MAG: hypothetical protein ACRD9R_16405 [Pyrinomonadaceae bacterium]